MNAKQLIAKKTASKVAKQKAAHDASEGLTMVQMLVLQHHVHDEIRRLNSHHYLLGKEIKRRRREDRITP